jgi:hypothetical protein
VNQPNSERLSVADAAKLLDVTPEAIRQRIRRGTIDHEKTEDGRYFVYVTPSQGVENDVHNNLANPALLAHIETLKHELEVRNEELRRKDTIIMSLTQRIPELEPARETRDGDLTASEDAHRGGSREASEPVAGERRERSWWRRLFDG